MQQQKQDQRHRRSSWCCSFNPPPYSPDYYRNPNLNLNLTNSTTTNNNIAKHFPHKHQTPNPSPPQHKLGIVVGRILSPGRVSPLIDLNTLLAQPSPQNPKQQQQHQQHVVDDVEEDEECVAVKSTLPAGIFDVRLCLKGNTNGECLVLEANSDVLIANSSFFAHLIVHSRNQQQHGGMCRIEVPHVDDLTAFHHTLELMFHHQHRPLNCLLKHGVSHSIQILEVSASIKFMKGVSSCLKYLEAVPWNEEEEDKLRRLFGKYQFDPAMTKDILVRLNSPDAADSMQTLARKLVWSLTESNDSNARDGLKSLVKGLLCRSSVYEKNYPDLTKKDIYDVCHSCLHKLVIIFEEACGDGSSESMSKREMGKSLIERTSMQVDNINWLLEILLDRHMADDFVDIWTNQRQLIRMHEAASPMVRFELSRVSAMVFMAMGTRRLQCRGEGRLGLLQAWLGPMLLDFGWLRRCKRGLDMRVLEETIGKLLLTVPLKHQYMLFMQWFNCFSKQGTECPNLSEAFQIWWRRSFLAVPVGSSSSVELIPN